MSCIPSFLNEEQDSFPMDNAGEWRGSRHMAAVAEGLHGLQHCPGTGKAVAEEHCSPHKRGCYNARSLTSEDWTSLHHTHSAPFIPLEGINYSHPNTKQKLDSPQEKLSVCQNLHHCTVITSLEVSKGSYILFCWWTAERFHFLHEMLNRTLLPPTHTHS